MDSALGVIGGYAGTLILDNLSIFVSKRLAEQQAELEQKRVKAEQELAKATVELEINTKARELESLADAYRRWGEWNDALRTCDSLITLEPNNPNNYTAKAIVYADKAAKEEKEGEPKSTLYNEAIKLANEAIRIKQDFDKGYYDRACFKQLNKEAKGDVFKDLKEAIRLNKMNKQWAAKDPDFKDLRDDPEFKALTGLISTSPPSQAPA